MSGAAALGAAYTATKKCPEYGELVAQIGETAADAAIKKVILEQAKNATLMGVTGAAIVTAAVATLGLALVPASMGAASMGGTVTASTVLGGAVNAATVTTKVGGGFMPSWMQSILWGIGYSGGTVIGYNGLNEVVRAAMGNPDKERDLAELATKTDDYLRSMGLDQTAIDYLRSWYRQYLGLPSGNGSTPALPTPTANTSSLVQWLSLYNSAINSGVPHQAAIAQVSSTMMFHPDAEFINALEQGGIAAAQKVAEDRAWTMQQRSWQTEDRSRNLSWEELQRQWALEDRGDNLADEALREEWALQDREDAQADEISSEAWQGTQRQWALEDREYTLGQRAYGTSERFYEIYDKMRARGLLPADAIAEAQRWTGFEPTEVILNELMDDEQELVDEMTGVYQTSETYAMIQQEIAAAFPDNPSPVDELDEIDFIPQSNPSPMYSKRSASNIGAGYGSQDRSTFKNGPYTQGENMPGIHRQGSKWVWNNTGRPVNAGARKSYGRRRRY